MPAGRSSLRLGRVERSRYRLRTALQRTAARRERRAFHPLRAVPFLKRPRGRWRCSLGLFSLRLDGGWIIMGGTFGRGKGCGGGREEGLGDDRDGRGVLRARVCAGAMRAGGFGVHVRDDCRAGGVSQGVARGGPGHEPRAERVEPAVPPHCERQGEPLRPPTRSAASACSGSCWKTRAWRSWTTRPSIWRGIAGRPAMSRVGPSSWRCRWDSGGPRYGKAAGTAGAARTAARPGCWRVREGRPAGLPSHGR